MGSSLALANCGLLHDRYVRDLLQIPKLAILGACSVLYPRRLLNAALLLPCRILHEVRTDLRMVSLAVPWRGPTVHNWRCSELFKDP